MKFETFIYFLECYFVQSFEFSDLEGLVYEFRYREKQHDVDELLKDLDTISSTNDWNAIKTMVDTYCSKIMTVDKIKSMVGTMKPALTNKEWKRHNYKAMF